MHACSAFVGRVVADEHLVADLDRFGVRAIAAAGQLAVGGRLPVGIAKRQPVRILPANQSRKRVVPTVVVHLSHARRSDQRFVSAHDAHAAECSRQVQGLCSLQVSLRVRAERLSFQNIKAIGATHSILKGRRFDSLLVTHSADRDFSQQ